MYYPINSLNSLFLLVRYLNRTIMFACKFTLSMWCYYDLCIYSIYEHLMFNIKSTKFIAYLTDRHVLYHDMNPNQVGQVKKLERVQLRFPRVVAYKLRMTGKTSGGILGQCD